MHIKVTFFLFSWFICETILVKNASEFRPSTIVNLTTIGVDFKVEKLEKETISDADGADVSPMRRNADQTEQKRERKCGCPSSRRSVNRTGKGVVVLGDERNHNNSVLHDFFFSFSFACLLVWCCGRGRGSSSFL